ncbi:putative membrane protein [Actinoalloteichus hoggarensis]|uniref:Uncharacterized protein n=1 Tax=Actinoalloteichus hoggarensis TaxID=1470176 RepID=A0A221VZY4_9PSEU|nr:DUF5808 domain-containing protein [Actinoalloteichus hoggarensis]ASO19080.1 hypothetical protein AHOG_07160 [Actinoalloteichus hoggarensis]MBB5920318.1 putative membrane protein [Actinoalloteichus hoggarensis]
MTAHTLLTSLHVLLITGVFWSMPALARPTLPFGIRVPSARSTDPALLAVRRRFQRRVLLAGGLAMLVLLLAIPAGATVPGWALAALGIADLVLYLLASRGVRGIKRGAGWYEGLRQAVTTDTTLRTDPVPFPLRWLIPALLLVAGTAALGVWRYPALPPTLLEMGTLGADPAHRTPTSTWSAFLPVLTQAGATLVTASLTLLILRARPELDAERPADSARRFRVYLSGVSRLLLFTVTCLNLALLVAACVVWELLSPGAPAIVLIAASVILAVGAWVLFMIRVGELGGRLPGSASGEADPDASADSGLVQRDDDRHWFLGGMVYVNRRDPALLVHRRVGVYWTLNLGHPGAWTILALIVVVAGTLGWLSAAGVITLPVRG